MRGGVGWVKFYTYSYIHTVYRRILLSRHFISGHFLLCIFLQNHFVIMVFLCHQVLYSIYVLCIGKYGVLATKNWTTILFNIFDSLNQFKFKFLLKIYENRNSPWTVCHYILRILDFYVDLLAKNDNGSLYNTTSNRTGNRKEQIY